MKISLRRRHTLTVGDGASLHKIDYVGRRGDSKYQRASKSHYWFKSYGNFAEWVNFVYWWRYIGKGLRLQPAQQACLLLQILAGITTDLKLDFFYIRNYKGFSI